MIKSNFYKTINNCAICSSDRKTNGEFYCFVLSDDNVNICSKCIWIIGSVYFPDSPIMRHISMMSDFALNNSCEL